MPALTGKVAWVTGAGSGIGRATAIALAREGATLVLTGRRPEPLQETAARIGGGAVVKPGNVADASNLAGIVHEVRSEFGRLDVVVNNAGMNITRRSLAD